MDQVLRRRVRKRLMESSTVIKASGAFFFSKLTNRWLFLMRADGKYENTWGLVGGKTEGNELPIDTLVREMSEEIGNVTDIIKIIPIEKFTNVNFEYNTYVCVVEKEFIPILNSEHKGYCWTEINSYPKPLHPGVFNSVNLDTIKNKILTIQEIDF